MFVALVTPCRGNACSVCTRVQCLTLPFFHDSFFMLEEKKMKIANPSKKKPPRKKTSTLVLPGGSDACCFVQWRPRLCLQAPQLHGVRHRVLSCVDTAL